jgi:hypothetical protein
MAQSSASLPEDKRAKRAALRLRVAEEASDCRVPTARSESTLGVQIVDTERSYVEGLATLCELYMKGLQDKASPPAPARACAAPSLNIITAESRTSNARVRQRTAAAGPAPPLPG